MPTSRCPATTPCSAKPTRRRCRWPWPSASAVPDTRRPDRHRRTTSCSASRPPPPALRPVPAWPSISCASCCHARRTPDRSDAACNGCAAVLFSHLNFTWRVLGTGLGFVVFLGGGFLLAVLAFPAIDFLTRDTKLRRERHHVLIRWAFRLFIGVLTRLGIIAVRLEEIAALSQSRGTIVVATQPSLIDVVLISATIPRVQCIVKRELWSSPFLGPVMRANGYIRADLEPEALVAACREALADGRSL